jgi:hypothetical protein
MGVTGKCCSICNVKVVVVVLVVVVGVPHRWGA